jgi:Transposase DDE domain group 1
VKQRNRWDRALKLEASGAGMVGHAGAVLLHRTADRIGLVGRLRGVLRASPWLLDRADVLVSLIVGIGLGAVNLAQAELLARHHTVVLGGQASDSTLWRTLEEIDAKTREEIGRARALVRVRVWALLEARDARFPWITLLGRELVGWVVIDMDATVITAASNKEQAAGTFKKTFGHHPLAAWCGNTVECLAMRDSVGDLDSGSGALAPPARDR